MVKILPIPSKLSRDSKVNRPRNAVSPLRLTSYLTGVVYLDTLTTEKQLLLYMDRQLEILQQDGQASREAMEQYRQTLKREAQNTTSTMESAMKSLERQVGKMNEEFGRSILQEQERMKNTSKKLFWISMIPSLILVVWELTWHIWLLG